MESWVEKYLNHLDTLSGSNAEYYRASPPDEFPPVSVVTYWGDEETRLITSFTAGLSSVFHPSWKFARPELCISVESQDLRWGWAIGDIAYKLRGHCPFCYGEIINFGTQISKESDMSAFVVFAPTALGKEEREIQLPDWKVSIAQMYPLYQGEIGLIESIGLGAFLQQPGNFFCNVNRKDLSQ